MYTKLQSVLENNNSIIKQRLKEIVLERLEEKRGEIIQKEFGFLNESGMLKRKSVVRYHHFDGAHRKPVAIPIPKHTLKHKTNTIEKDFTNPSYRKVRGSTKVKRISSIEKFRRISASKIQTANRSRHIAVAVRKRKQFLQKQKAIGAIKHQKQKALGLPHPRGRR